MRYGYYPGCALHGSAREFDLSIKECCQALGIELVEVPDWNCCGASAAHEVSEELSLALPLRVLSQAEGYNMNTIMAPCAACYSRLKRAGIKVARDPAVVSRINELIGQEYKGGVAVKHLIEVLKENQTTLESTVVRPLEGLKVACYYGCLLVRPPEVADFDDAENPVTMDEIVRTLGAEPVGWSHKTECCGASFSFSKPDIAARLVGDILEAALQAEADVIAVACPLCHANLDMRQAAAARKLHKKYSIPILYISQLIGLAQGKDRRLLGLDKHVVSPDNALQSLKAPSR